jgi:NADH:ubiquinone reductase (non-electrogenic)
MPYATFLQAECTDLDAAARTVTCEDGEMTARIPYDHLVVAVGTQPNTFGIPGVQQHALFLKELDHGLVVRQRLLDQLEKAVLAHATGRFDEVRRLLTIAVVGGGPTGVEFAGEVADLVNSDLVRSFPAVAHQISVTLVEAQPDVLAMFEKSIGEHVKDHLTSIGVAVRTSTMVKLVDDVSITLQTTSGETETMGYGMLVWVAGVGARPITKKFASKLGQSNPRGLEVDDFLRVRGSSGNEIFALGDCTVSGNAWTAQVAAQQGKYLARAFRDEDANPLLPFSYKHQGTMAYVGEGQAVAVLSPPSSAMPGIGKITKNFAKSSFFRQLASCPDSMLKPEHRTGTMTEPSAKKFELNIFGLSGFAVWRGVYFTKLFSYSNRFNVATDWIRNFFFGRVVASSTQRFERRQ